MNINTNSKDNTKICTKCNQDKSTKSFYKCRKSPDGFRTFCKNCMSDLNSKDQNKKTGKLKLLKSDLNEIQFLMFKQCGGCNQEKTYFEFKENLKETLQGCLTCYCKSCIVCHSSKYYKENKEVVSKRVRNWRKNNKNKVKASRKNARENNPQLILRDRSRAKIARYIGYDSDRQIHDFIGCTSNGLKRHLSAQFKEGMTWENYGVVWNVDHKIPLCKFDLTISENMFKANHYTNLRPAYIEDNCGLTEEQKLVPFQN